VRIGFRCEQSPEAAESNEDRPAAHLSGRGKPGGVRAVPGEFGEVEEGVGSGGLRLATPKATEPDVGTNPDPVIERAIGRVSADIGVMGTAREVPGRPTAGTAGTTQQAAPTVPVEREIAFSLVTSMADSDTRDAVRRLLSDLSNAADDSKISWAQVQIKVVVASDVADELETDIRAAGTTPSSRDV